MEAIYRIVDELVVLVWDLFVDGLLGAPGSNPYPALAGELGWEPLSRRSIRGNRGPTVGDRRRIV